MSSLTIEKALAISLRRSNASKTVGALVMIMLDTPLQMAEMCRFLLDNPDATEQEIAQAATGILDRFPSENEDDL